MDYLVKMNIFNIPWLNPYYNKKIHKKIIKHKRLIMSKVLNLLFVKLIIPFLRLNFYITEIHGFDKKVFDF